MENLITVVLFIDQWIFDLPSNRVNHIVPHGCGGQLTSWQNRKKRLIPISKDSASNTTNTSENYSWLFSSAYV